MSSMKRAFENNRGVIGMAALAVGAILVGALGAVVIWNAFHSSEEASLADTETTSQTEETNQIEQQEVQTLTPSLQTVQQALDEPEPQDCEEKLAEVGLSDNIDCLKETIIVDVEYKPIYDPEPCDGGILLENSETGIIRCLDEDPEENVNIEEVDIEESELQLLIDPPEEFIPRTDDPIDL